MFTIETLQQLAQKAAAENYPDVVAYIKRVISIVEAQRLILRSDVEMLAECHQKFWDIQPWGIFGLIILMPLVYGEERDVVCINMYEQIETLSDEDFIVVWEFVVQTFSIQSEKGLWRAYRAGKGRFFRNERVGYYALIPLLPRLGPLPNLNVVNRMNEVKDRYS